MTPRSPARKALTVVAALAAAGAFLWFLGSRVFVMSGTKATFSFVGTRSVPAGGPGGPAPPATTTPATPTTSAAPTATTLPAAGGR